MMNEEQSLLITYELDGLLVLLSPIVAAFVISAIAGFGTVFGTQSRTPRKLAGARVRRAERNLFEIRTQQALNTLIRIGIPTVSAAVLGLLYFDNLSLYLSSNLSPQTLAILSRDNLSGQYVQNFLVVIDLLFAILAGSAFAELYQQQESIYNALYKEVSIAQILLEQLTLVGQARPWYPKALAHMSDYLENDLRQLQVSPVEQLSANPSVDPLESIMRLTSVGELAWKRRLLPRARLAPPLHLLRLRTTLFSPTFHPCPSVRRRLCPGVPSVVYESVKDLREARGERLGAFQRKFPTLGITLLYLLASIELFAFPLLGAGTAEISEVPELAPTVSILGELARIRCSITAKGLADIAFRLTCATTTPTNPLPLSVACRRIAVVDLRYCERLPGARATHHTGALGH